MLIKKFNIDINSGVFIIAELSANHNGNLEVALESVRAAKRAGADCIKLQTYTADTITIDSNNDDFIIKGTIWEGKNLYQLYKEAYTPWEWHEANMVMVKDFAERFGVIAGLSDHTMGVTVPVVATCFGAKIIEKHFILDRSIGGPDASFSMNEQEFTAMVKAVREAEMALGVVDYTLTEKQAKGKDFSRSLYVVENMRAGDIVSEKNVSNFKRGYFVSGCA